MVAKSYQGMELVGKPYAINSKMYVKVKNEKTGMIRQVRWYSDAEYQKLYGELPAATAPKMTQKEALGFKAGFITIFIGNTYENKEWFKEIGCMYRKFWGWGLPGDIELPEDLPGDVTPIRLEWDQVGYPDETLKPEDQVKAFVDSLTYEPSVSEFQGNVGDKLTLDVTVVRAVRLDGYYGPSTMHIMEDAVGNVYVWTTASKSWAEGSEHSIKGTVKEHKTYKNTKQTILTRCTERKAGK